MTSDKDMDDLIDTLHCTEIEKALLGAILTNNQVYQRVADLVRPEHFYEPVLGRIYEASAKLINLGQVADPWTLWPYFEDDPSLENVGGAQYLFDLAAGVVTAANARQYANDIRDLYLRRQLIGEDAELTVH